MLVVSVAIYPLPTTEFSCSSVEAEIDTQRARRGVKPSTSCPRSASSESSPIALRLIPESNHLPMECKNSFNKCPCFPSFWLTMLQGILSRFQQNQAPIAHNKPQCFPSFSLSVPSLLLYGIHSQIHHLHWSLCLGLCFQGSWAKDSRRP